MSSRKKKNVINLITRISVIGIAVITAALIILLSAFNGIEKMIEALYSEYDSDLTIRSEQWKTFNDKQIDIEKIKAVNGVLAVSRAVEEVVILKHEKKWVNATMVGVDSVFLSMTNMSKHMVDGVPILQDRFGNYGIIGATLLDKLDGYVPKNAGHESITLFIPKRKIKIRPGANPFKTHPLKISGRMNYNREVNIRDIVVPIGLAREMLDYNNQLTALYIDVDPRFSNDEVKKVVSQVVGDQFTVKTNFEKNELIFQTSKSEKLIVLIILLFIFVLAAFSLVAALTMLFVEKIDNIKTMLSFGASKKFIFRIFFYEGLLIAGKGIVIGAVIGYAICIAQLKWGVLTMPNSNGEAFPIALSFVDGAMILGLVGLLSFFFSYFPVKYLIYKNVSTGNRA